MKQVGIYSVLLTVAMVGAYITWTSDADPEAEAADEAVAMYSARTGDVKALAFDGEALDVKVERRSDAHGEYVWVIVDEVKEKKLPPKPHDHGHEGEDGEHEGEDGPDIDDAGEGAGEDAGEGSETPDAIGPDAEAPAEDEPAVEKEEIHQEFLGNDSAVGMFESFEPLMALRELSAAGADLELFGLDDVDSRIVITRSGGDTSIELGGETYGSRDRYARLDGRLFLIEDTTVRPLQFAASRLVERRLHPLAEKDIDRITVRKGAEERGLVHRNKDDPQASFWARGGDEDSKDDIAATWIDKLLRIKVGEYATDTDVSTLSESFAVTLHSGSDTWSLAVLEDPASDKVYARSDYNRGTVELTASLANEAIADLSDLFAE